MMKALKVLVLLAVVAVLASPALAGCFPNKQAGQLIYPNSGDPVFGYTYFTNSSNSYADMVGRFWTPGLRSTANEGTYDISQWMPFWGADKGQMNATLGDAQVLGCPGGELITVVQAVANNGKGALFAVGRVTEIGGVSNTDFDYTRTAVNWNLVPVPAPPMNATKAGTVLTLNGALPDPSAVFYGLTGVQYTGTITGMRLMRAVGSTTPGAAVANWTDTGIAGAAGTAFGPLTFDCTTAGAGNDLYYAARLVFDNDAVRADYVGVPTQIKCNSGLANPIIKEHKPKKH